MGLDYLTGRSAGLRSESKPLNNFSDLAFDNALLLEIAVEPLLATAVDTASATD